ncbi:MAG TPA: NADH-quinone oxidoreductase subunit N, partial [Roseiflexaceae bacterium]|nr:NADH-quinone oxidoreductase subunit N [Roseiflexaceae bacterium]
MTFQLSDIPRLLPELMVLFLALLVMGSDVLGRWGRDLESQQVRAAEAAQLTRAGLVIALIITLIQSRFVFTVPEAGANGVLEYVLGLVRNIQAAGTGGAPVVGAYAIDNVTMIARIVLFGTALLVTLLVPAQRPIANVA